MNTRPSLYPTTIEELRARKVELVSRLNDGDEQIHHRQAKRSRHGPVGEPLDHAAP